MMYEEIAKMLVVPAESAIVVWAWSGPCVQALERADVYVVHPLSLFPRPPTPILWPHHRLTTLTIAKPTLENMITHPHLDVVRRRPVHTSSSSQSARAHALRDPPPVLLPLHRRLARLGQTWTSSISGSLGNPNIGHLSEIRNVT